MFILKIKIKKNQLSSLIHDGKKYRSKTYHGTFQQFLHKYHQKIAKKIPPTKNNFSSVLKNPNNQTLIITPISLEEVNDVISVIKTSKSTEPSSLQIKIMKQWIDIIASPLVK